MATQPKFFDMPNPFERELWRKHLRLLMQHDRNLDKQRDTLPWEIGDCLIEGVRGGLKPRVLKREVMAIIRAKYSWNTLNNFMTVSKAVEPSRRRESLDYSTHLLVAKFSPEDQDRLLDLAEKGDPNGVHKDGTYQRYSVRNFKNLIADMQERGELPKAGRTPRETQSVTVGIKMPITEYDKLKALATAKGFTRQHHKRWAENPFLTPAYDPDVAGLLWWMALEYFKEHKTELLDAVRKPAKS